MVTITTVDGNKDDLIFSFVIQAFIVTRFIAITVLLTLDCQHTVTVIITTII